MAEDADENEDSNPKTDIPGDANKDKIDDNITNEIGIITKRMSNIMLASPASSSCAFKSCVQEQNENEYILECSKCKQRTHYYCTQLPDYQIALFLQKGYRLFKCKACVGAIHEDILNNCAAVKQKRENDTLRNDLATVNNDKVKQKSEILILKARVMQMEVEKRKEDELLKEIKLLKDKSTKLVKVTTTSAVQTQIDVTEDKASKYHKEKICLLEKDLQEKSTKLTEAHENLNKTVNDFNKKSSEIKNLVEQLKTALANGNILQSIIEEREKTIDEIQLKLSEGMRTIDKKLDVVTSNKAYAEKVKESVIGCPNQHSTTVSSPNNAENDFRAIMKDARNEELVQEQERKERSRNLIIHGVPQLKEENDSIKNKSHDEEFVNKFLTNIDIAQKPLAIHRIGKPSNRDRPIKVIMNNDQEQINIMRNFSKLKDADEQFKKLRITDDFTIEEREEIRKWVQKAKLKNNEEGENKRVCQGHSKKRSTPGENHQEVNSHSGNKDESIIMTKCKCAICNENNQLDQQGKKCEKCKTWKHKTYQDEPSSMLNIRQTFSSSDTSNFNFNLHDNLTTNEPSTNVTFVDTNKMSEPKHSSTPKKPHPKSVVNHRPLRIINVNCQSLCNKKERFINDVDSTKPDIIIATETWLNPNIYSSEFFSPSYTIFRRDRITNTTGGGVLIAVNRCYKCEEYVIPKHTNSELIWIKLTTKGDKRLYIGACYRPDKSDEKTLNDCDDYLQAITKNENNVILLGRDFNLEGWDWGKNVIKPNARYVAIHQLFENILDNHGLKQIVDEPTRKNAVLDLLITNRPNKILRTEIQPGIATGDDHQVVYSELDISPYRIKQHPRKINLYNKADWPGFKELAKNIGVDIKSNKNTCTIEEL